MASEQSNQSGSKDYYFEMIRIDGETVEVQRWSKNYHHRIGKPQLTEGSKRNEG